MVGHGVRNPSHVPGRAIIVHVQHPVAVNIIVACVTVCISVEVGLVAVGELGAVVQPVKDPVEVEVGLVQPNAHVVMVALQEGVSAVGSIAVGDKRDHG